MSESRIFAPKSSLLYAKYRGEYAPIPMAQTLGELDEIIQQRVKPGLNELLDNTELPQTEYAGYAFTSYRNPIEKMDLFESFGGQDTINALKSAALDVDTNPRDDFWVEYFDLFDRMLESDGSWSQGVDPSTGLSGLKNINFLLGPVVRGPHGWAAADAYNQNADTNFDHKSAVYVSGKLLLKGLYGYRAHLSEGVSVPSRTIASYFMDEFGLHPATNKTPAKN